MDGAALGRIQEELYHLREETFTPGRLSARVAGVSSSVWSWVPGFVEFVNGTVPFEDFEKMFSMKCQLCESAASQA